MDKNYFLQYFNTINYNGNKKKLLNTISALHYKLYHMLADFRIEILRKNPKLRAIKY